MKNLKLAFITLMISSLFTISATAEDCFKNHDVEDIYFQICMDKNFKKNDALNLLSASQSFLFKSDSLTIPASFGSENVVLALRTSPAFGGLSMKSAVRFKGALSAVFDAYKNNKKTNVYYNFVNLKEEITINGRSIPLLLTVSFPINNNNPSSALYQFRYFLDNSGTVVMYSGDL